MVAPQPFPYRAAADVLADLRGAPSDGFVHFCDGLSGDGSEMSSTLDDLVAGAHVAAVRDRFAAKFGPTDPRAIMSIWAAWHFIATMPALVAMNVLLDRMPLLDARSATYRIAPDLRIESLVLTSEIACVAGQGAEGRFRPFVECYLAPFVARVAADTGTSQRVLWSNAGSTFDAVLRKFAPLFEGRAGHDAAQDVLATSAWRDGVPNPLFAPVQDRGGRPVRKICCMRFLVPDGRLCATCPLDRARFDARVAERTVHA